MKPFLYLLFLSFSLPVLAQTPDSLHVETTTTINSTRARPLDNRGKYRANEFWRPYREERTLIKIGFFGIPLLGTRYEVALEQKLAPAWSAGTNFNARHGISGSLNQAQMSGALFGRWYYNMQKRISQGRGGNNFVGNYLMARLNSPVYCKYTVKNPRLDSLMNRPPRLASSVDLGWGTQKRLGRWGYFDLFTGFSYALTSPAELGYKSNRLKFRFEAMLGFGL